VIDPALILPGDSRVGPVAATEDPEGGGGSSDPGRGFEEIDDW
jgi:hypothetical protein